MEPQTNRTLDHPYFLQTVKSLSKAKEPLFNKSEPDDVTRVFLELFRAHSLREFDLVAALRIAVEERSEGKYSVRKINPEQHGLPTVKGTALYLLLTGEKTVPFILRPDSSPIEFYEGVARR